MKSGTSAKAATGAADITQYIGIYKICRHISKAEGKLFRGDFFTLQTSLKHAAIAVVVQLTHAAAGIDANLFRSDFLSYHIPVNSHRIEGIGDAINSHLQSTWMISGG